MTTRCQWPVAVCFIFSTVVGGFPVAVSLGTDQPGRIQPVDEIPTFNRDIAPILFENCASCHRPGEVAPFSLLSYKNAKRRASQIVDVTSKRFMPPWLPEPGYGDFVSQRRLADYQIKTIRRWVDHGAVEGDPNDLPPAPKFTSGWQLGEPDLVLTLSKPYTLGPDGTDVFRNFVIPNPERLPRYVRAIEVRPGNARIVHHANIRVDPTHSCRALDMADPDPGFGGMLPGKAQFPPGAVLIWTPGRLPIMEQEGFGWVLEPGVDLVLQLHLQPTGKPEMILPSIGFFFGQTPPTPLLLAIQLESHSLDIPAGAKDHQVKSSFKLPVAVQALGIYPHAHYLGKQMRAIAKLPDGSQKWLLRINDWDFNWQDEYRFSEPVLLPKGTVISMDYLYDNSKDNVRNINHPPIRVRYGPRSSDEMGGLSMQVLVQNTEDLEVISRDLWQYGLGVEIEGFQARLKVEPKDYQAHNGLALAFLQTQNFRGAFEHMEQAVNINPDFTGGHYNLGTMYLRAGQFKRAIMQFERVIEINPDLAEAYNNLGIAYAQRNEVEKSITEFERALVVNPDYTEARNNLGRMRAILGQRKNQP